MMSRKTTPGVRGGQVQKKNNWTEEGTYYNSPQPLLVVDRKRPGAGFRHLLSKQDIHDFLALLPNREELIKSLNAVVLAPGDWQDEGYYVPGVVHIHAWPKDLWVWWHPNAYEHEREFLDRIGVEVQRDGGEVLLRGGRFNEPPRSAPRCTNMLHVHAA